MKNNSKYIGLVTSGLMAFPVFNVVAQQQTGFGPLEEVVVTARKREESLSDVPMFINAMSNLQLERAGIHNAADFVGNMPSVSKSGDFLSPGKEFMMMVIRGVGANGGMEPAAPVFLDGVYMPRLGFDTNFMDVERVELLYGPQSTLFGRNTEAGAISIVTKKPSEETRARVVFEVDDFDTYKASGAVSGQIAENWYAGVSIEGMNTKGYLTNVGTTNVNTGDGVSNESPGAFFEESLNGATDPDGAQSIAGRLSLRWVPSDKFEALLTLDTYSFEGGVGLPGVPAGCDCYETDLDLVLDSEHTSEGATLRIEYSTDYEVDLTSITAYRDLGSKSPFDLDGGSTFGLPEGVTPAVLETNIPGVTNTHRGNIQDYRFDQEVFSQELRLSSASDDPLQWLLGFYYFDESFFSDRNIDMMGANVFPFFTRRGQDVDADRDGWAVFGQATYDLLDSVQLTLGLRYSDEKSEAFSFLSWESPVFPDFLNQNLGGSHTKKFSDDNLDYTASIRWDMNENISTFFTTSTAFKSGGYQLAFTGDPDVDQPYDSEHITSYEIGFKANFMDNQLRSNLSFFYLNLEDMQVRTIQTFNNLPFTVVSNGAEATNKGITFDVEFYPTNDLRLTASFGYVDATFDEFVAGGLDFSGERLRFVPEITANIGAEWILPVSKNWFDTVAVYGNWRYVDEQIQGYDGLDVDIGFVNEDYDLLDLGARMRINDKVTATLFVDNVTDEYVTSRQWNVFLFTDPGDVPRTMSTVLAPRRIGFRVNYDF